MIYVFLPASEIFISLVISLLSSLYLQINTGDKLSLAIDFSSCTNAHATVKFNIFKNWYVCCSNSKQMAAVEDLC